MARIEISSVSNPYGTGELQLQGKVAMSGTLTAVTDNLNTASPLKLSTGGVQVASTLQITTNSNPYIDAEDGAGNNRFTVGRDPSSQVVNVDFASNPTGGTNQVGAIRTYRDGISLSNVMSFRKDGNVGVGVTNPITNLQVNGTILSGDGSGDTYSSLGSALGNYGGVGSNYYTIGGAYYRTYNDSVSQLYFNGGGFQFRNAVGGIGANSLIGFNSQMEVGVGGGGYLTLGTNVSGTINGAKFGILSSGSTSGTKAMLILNSSYDQIFQIQDDGSSTFGRSGANSNATFYGNTGVQGIIGNGQFQTPNAIYTYNYGTTMTFYNNNNNGNGFSYSFNNQQSSNSTGVSMINLGGNWQNQNDFEFANLRIQPNYDFNASTGTLAIARGIYYNPTITNLRVAQHRANDTTMVDLLLNTTSGNTLIGSSVSNTAKLSIKGSGSTSGTTSLLVQNSAGSNALQVKDDLTTTLYSNLTIQAGGIQLDPNRSLAGYNIYGTSLNLIKAYGTQIYIGDSNSEDIVMVTGWSVLIGTTTRDNSSILTLASTTRGFLPPRMTDAQVRAIVSPAVGLMAYNTDLDCPVFYSTAGWRKVSHSVM